MNDDAIQAITEAAGLLIQARERLEAHGSSKAHLLLDMLLLDMAEQLARLTGDIRH